jgi:hypothetical protein
MLERVGRGKGCTYRLLSPDGSEQSSEQTAVGSEQSRAKAEAIEPPPRKAERHWLPRKEMVQAILAHCRDRFMTLMELSGSLELKPDSIRVPFVRPMLRQGLLE